MAAIHINGKVLIIKLIPDYLIINFAALIIIIIIIVINEVVSKCFIWKLMINKTIITSKI